MTRGTGRVDDSARSCPQVRWGDSQRNHCRDDGEDWTDNSEELPGGANISVILESTIQVGVGVTWQELAQRRVTLTQVPVDMPFGRWSLFEDTEGDRFPLTGKA